MSKDAIICKIIEKKYVDQSIASATPQIDVANVTIHDNFHLINMMFTDETIDMSDECGSIIQAKLLPILHFGFMWLQSSIALVWMETQTWKA